MVITGMTDAPIPWYADGFFNYVPVAVAGCTATGRLSEGEPIRNLLR